MPKSIRVEGEQYELITERRNNTGVYRGNDTYMRLGSREALKKDVQLHREMEALGFPIARFLSEGDIDGAHYFRESSVGSQRLNDAFVEDMKLSGSISDKQFDAFLKITIAFTEAQFKTVVKEKDIAAFAHAIHLPILFKERPDLQKKVEEVCKRMLEKISALPFVLTHGDFNPANMYPDGIIDLEDSFKGPLGYDPVTALVTTEWFPDSPDYEYRQRYSFNTQQRHHFIAAMDDLYRTHGYPPLSEHFEALAFFRAIWHVVNMSYAPKIEAWRFQRFIDLYLNTD